MTPPSTRTGKRPIGNGKTSITYWTTCGPHVLFARRSRIARGWGMVREILFQVCCQNSRVRGPSTGPEGVANGHNNNVIDTVDIILEKRTGTSFGQSPGVSLLRMDLHRSWRYRWQPWMCRTTGPGACTLAVGEG